MSAAGRKRAAYLNTATYASPAWSELTRITNVQRPQSKATSDRMFRGAKNKKKVSGYKEFGFTFTYQVKKANLADTLYDTLYDSFLNDTVLDAAFLNQRIAQPVGTTAGNAVGVRGPVECTKFDIKEEDEDGVTIDIELSEVDHEESGDLVEVEAYSIALDIAT